MKKKKYKEMSMANMLEKLKGRIKSDGKRILIAGQQPVTALPSVLSKYFRESYTDIGELRK